MYSFHSFSEAGQRKGNMKCTSSPDNRELREYAILYHDRIYDQTGNEPTARSCAEVGGVRFVWFAKRMLAVGQSLVSGTCSAPS